MRYHEIMRLNKKLGLPWKEGKIPVFNIEGTNIGEFENFDHAQFLIFSANIFPQFVDAIQFIKT